MQFNVDASMSAFDFTQKEIIIKEYNIFLVLCLLSNWPVYTILYLVIIFHTQTLNTIFFSLFDLALIHYISESRLGVYNLICIL